MSLPDDPVVEEWAERQRRWLADRYYLNAHRRDLTDLAVRLYPRTPRLGTSTLLTRTGWAPTRPVPLDAITLDWVAPPVPVAVTGDEPETAEVRPPSRSAGRFPRYSAAMGALDPPRLFENRQTYRLVDATLTDTARVGFTMGAYFDAADTGEAAAHELAASVRAGANPSLADLPLRSLVCDPTDPTRRSMPTAITTLTIRYDQRTGDARFLAHWRDPAKVAANGGMYTVVPVGMFQPAGAAHDDGTGDFDLWRGMAREYSEELLGRDEHIDVDYAGWEFFAALRTARAEGGCRPYCLGIGVDPLTFATDILAVTVFDRAIFDEVFAGLVEVNDEGRTVTRSPDGTFGIPFTAQAVHRLLSVEHTQPAGAAVLETALRMREALLSR